MLCEGMNRLEDKVSGQSYNATVQAMKEISYVLLPNQAQVRRHFSRHEQIDLPQLLRHTQIQRQLHRTPTLSHRMDGSAGDNYQLWYL